RQVQRLMKAHPDYDPHFINDPHLTIARKLKPWQYEKAWQACSNSNFSGKFIATEMFLYKRLVDTTSYIKAATFHFKNDTAVINQGQLF
ncbi:MAG: 2'-5' RNA ligase family protein, partial [Ferruginibacter sp.]